MLGCILLAVLASSAQLSPFTIAAGINGKPRSALTEIWQQLDVKPIAGLFNSSQDSHRPLLVDVVSLDLNADSKNDALIKVTNGWDYQYLIFLDLDKWIFVGNIDLDMQKYAPPSERIESGKDGTCWLVIHMLDSSGTGVLMEQDHWYDVSSKGIRETVEVPVNGNICTMEAYWHAFTAKVIGVSRNRITYQYKVRFFVYPYEKVDPDEFDLLAFERVAVFRYQIPEGRFRLDPESSEMTFAQIENLGADGREGLFMHYFEDLRKLAIDGNLTQRVWLRRYLGNSPDSPGKEVLLAILDKRSKLD